MTSCPRDAAGDVPLEPLPDLLGLSLAELRRLDHPVLSEVLDELRERLRRPGETLWDFLNSPPEDPNASAPRPSVASPCRGAGARPPGPRRGVDRGT